MLSFPLGTEVLSVVIGLEDLIPYVRF